LNYRTSLQDVFAHAKQARAKEEISFPHKKGISSAGKSTDEFIKQIQAHPRLTHIWKEPLLTGADWRQHFFH
jgi:hypothetical protein